MSKSKDLFSSVRNVFDNAPYVQLLGIELFEVGDGQCVSKLSLEEKHFQHLGRVHGAALAALSGQTALGAATSVVSEEEYVVCPDFKVSLLRAAEGGTLRSTANVIKSGKMLVFVEADVIEEGKDPNKPILKASYTFTKLQKKDGV